MNENGVICSPFCFPSQCIISPASLVAGSGSAVYSTPIPRVEPAIFINDLLFTECLMLSAPLHRDLTTVNRLVPDLFRGNQENIGANLFPNNGIKPRPAGLL